MSFVLNRWLPFVLFAWFGNAYGVDQSSLAVLLEDVRAEMKMPGVRAAVRLANGRIVRASAGLADVEANIALDDAVGMPGGSTGKTFVAALAMLLVEEGVLSVDDPAAMWLGETWWYNRLPNADQIRVQHLLSHSSGIADYPDTIRYQLAAGWRGLRRGTIRFEPEELIGFVLDRKPPFSAGDGFMYTDTGYLVLGRLIEAAIGRGYYELLEERILEAQQLDEIRPADQSILPDITPGYIDGGIFGLSRNLDKSGRMKFDPTSEWTGGGLVVNPTMLVRFYAALAEGRVVRPETFSRMLDGGWRNPETPEYHYGFGLYVLDGGNAIVHGGKWPGYRSRIHHDLRTGTTIAVQTNRDGRLDLQGLVMRIAALVPIQ